MEPGHFRRGPVPLAKQHEILGSDQLTALPQMGDAIECEWAERMAQIIKSKLEKLNDPDFEKRERNWIAVMDSLPIHNGLIPKALTYLKPLISSCWSLNPAFDQVFIDDGGLTLLWITENSEKLLQIPALWTRKTL